MPLQYMYFVETFARFSGQGDGQIEDLTNSNKRPGLPREGDTEILN